MVDTIEMTYPPDYIGDRVALMLKLQLEGQEDPFLLVATHLTFPHNEYPSKRNNMESVCVVVVSYMISNRI
jgi:hypothetical protein